MKTKAKGDGSNPAASALLRGRMAAPVVNRFTLEQLGKPLTETLLEKTRTPAEQLKTGVAMLAVVDSGIRLSREQLKRWRRDDQKCRTSRTPTANPPQEP